MDVGVVRGSPNASPFCVVVPRIELTEIVLSGGLGRVLVHAVGDGFVAQPLRANADQLGQCGPRLVGKSSRACVL